MKIKRYNGGKALFAISITVSLILGFSAGTLAFIRGGLEGIAWGLLGISTMAGVWDAFLIRRLEDIIEGKKKYPKHMILEE